MVVQRRFANASGPVSTVAVGDVISVTVTILAPTDPVLASDVKSEAGTDPDRLGFSLAAEGGLNDGAAGSAGPSVPGWVLTAGMWRLQHSRPAASTGG